MDIFKEDFRGNYRFRNIGAFCPKCYAFTEVGDVNVKIHADFSEGFSPEQFEVEPVSLMTYPQKCTGSNDLDILHPIMIRCPDCKSQMIIVDAEMLQQIVRLNQMGAYTAHSCSGIHKHYYRPYDSMNAYIKFARRLPDEMIKAISDIKDLVIWERDPVCTAIRNRCRFFAGDNMNNAGVHCDSEFDLEGSARFVFDKPLFQVEMNGWAVNLNDLNPAAVIAYTNSENPGEYFWDRLADCFDYSEAGQIWCEENLKRWPTLYDYYDDMNVVE